MEKHAIFKLPSGRWLYLRELRQYETYEGLLEGLPTAERNKQNVERLVDEHRDRPYPGMPYLIHPTEKPIEYKQGGGRYPFGTPSALPAVTCIGRFTSLKPVRKKDYDQSGLVVIWFQEQFAYPIAPCVEDKILTIDWEAHAADIYL